MSDDDRRRLIASMGEDVGTVVEALKVGDVQTAQAFFIRFMGAAGVLAMEINELDSTAGN